MLLKPAIQNKKKIKLIFLFFYKIFLNNSRCIIHWTTLFEKNKSIYNFNKANFIIFYNKINDKKIWSNNQKIVLNEPIKLTYLGRIDYIKNLDQIINAVKYFNNKNKKKDFIKNNR